MHDATREKLVRDRIPELYPDGAYRVAEPGEYGALLCAKLVEETDEYLADRNPEELADVLEVVRALAGEHGLDLADLERIRAGKAARRGGFAARIVLRESAEDDRPVRRSVRAILLDGDDLILFRRVRPGRPEPYHLTPGGAIEPGDASPEAALRRELYEELGATAGPAVPLPAIVEPGAHHTIFACRLRTLDLTRRSATEFGDPKFSDPKFSDPTFGDPAMGSYEVVRIPCTAEGVRSANLLPAGLADFIAANAAILPRLVDEVTYAPGRYRPVVDVHLVIMSDGKVLLGRRQGTGYADGEWQIMPSGHLEQGESVIDATVREAKEELGLDLDPADIEAAHVMHHRNPGGTARIGMFFVARGRLGEPVNREPHKCAELAWFPVDDLPEDTVPYSAAGIRAVLDGGRFSLHGWDVPDAAALAAEAVRAGYAEMSVAVIAHRDDAVLVLSDKECDHLPEDRVRPGESLEQAAARLLPGPARYVAAEDYVSAAGTSARRFAFAVPLPDDAPLPPNGRLLPAHPGTPSSLPVAQLRFVSVWRALGRPLSSGSTTGRWTATSP